MRGRLRSVIGGIGRVGYVSLSYDDVGMLGCYFCGLLTDFGRLQEHNLIMSLSSRILNSSILIPTPEDPGRYLHLQYGTRMFI